MVAAAVGFGFSFLDWVWIYGEEDSALGEQEFGAPSKK
jgi:hypothetical protein